MNAAMLMERAKHIGAGPRLIEGRHPAAS
jgi:hypothetical protein